MIGKLALLLPLVIGSSAMAQQFGSPVTLTQETKISEILANPDAYNGKLVKVRGAVVEVCPKRGCWIRIASDKRFQSIQFKVEDGVITFPETLKGSEVVAEGAVFVVAPVEEAECEADGKATQSGPAPKVVRINGLGAIAR